MVTAIRAGLLWDGTGAEPVRDGVVLVDGERVVAAGPAGQVGVPSDAQLVERPDEFLMPGLIDAHTHITIIPGLGDQTGQLMQPIERQVLRGTGNLRRMLRSGVTTARIMAEEHWLDVTFKQEIEAGTVAGPRLLVCTRAITPSNGHGRSIDAFDGVDEVRKGARENLHAGADFLKLFVTGGVSSTRGGLNSASYSREEIRVAVEEAERAGTYVAAHAIVGPGIRLAVEEGVRTIEHATLATDDDLALIKERGAWVVLTQSIMLHPTGIEQGDRDNPAIMAKLRDARGRAAERYRAILRSGVRYAVGTDSMHGLLPWEMAQLIEWGATPREALLAGTRWAAECSRIDDQVGTLSEGKLADLLTVRGNPLDDLSALEHLDMIMKAGRRYDDLSVE
ncbi:MAG TPA: amidohydrolase family protein [Thermomicrobiaceae bacterium]|nr:amidohydrolase family protein [Thermomicrobiaceae bacterium]